MGKNEFRDSVKDSTRRLLVWGCYFDVPMFWFDWSCPVSDPPRLFGFLPCLFTSLRWAFIVGMKDLIILKKTNHTHRYNTNTFDPSSRFDRYLHYPLAVHGPTHPQIASMNYQRPPISAGAHSTPSNRSSQSTTQTSEQDDSSSDGMDFLTPKSTAKNMVKTPKSTARTPKNTVKTQQAKRSFNYHQPSSNQLDYFANNHFSRSFNSLILDDIKDELSASGKKKINKSPPFNVKHDYYGDNDSLDDCIEDDDKPVTFDSDINDTKADTDVNDTRADRRL